VFALALVLSVVGLAVGPLLVAVGRGRAHITAAVEGLTLGVVPLLVALKLIPHVMEELGPAALLIVAAGYGGLWLADRKRHDLGDRVGYAVLIPSLAVHALADGAGLSIAFAASREQGVAGMLIGLAIVVHRMPEGLLIATRFVPVLGWSRTLAWLAILAGATLVGALAGSAVLEHVPDALFDVIVAVGLGVMLRMVAHIHTPIKDTRGARAAGGIAFLAGIAGALAIPSPESVLDLAQPKELTMARSVLPLFVATAPALLVGLLVVGLSRALTRRPSPDTLGRASHFAQATWGAALGITRPAGAHPRLEALRKMLGEGLPAATVVAHGIAALELNPGGVAILVVLVGAPIALTHAAVGALLAIALGVIAGRAAVGMSSIAAPATGAEEQPEGAPFLEDAWKAANAALDRGGAWYIAGIILAGAVEAALTPGLGSSAVTWGVPAGLAVGAALGALTRLPLLAAAPLAAVMIHKGFLTGAVIAFVLAASFPWGAGALELNARRKGRFAAMFALMGVTAAVIAGLIGDALALAIAGGSRGAPELHSLLSADRGPVAWGAASLLAALLAVSVVRLGPRAWIGAMLSPAHR
jgi:uncharacterized protein